MMTVTASNCANKEGIVIGRALVDGHAEVVPVPIMNPMSDSVALSTLVTIGWLEPIQYAGYDSIQDEELGLACEAGRLTVYACKQVDATLEA